MTPFPPPGRCFISARANFRTSWDKFDKASDGIVPESEVAFDTLDNYVETHGVRAIDFIKLDVDGYELKVLKGAIKSLKRFSPIILLELGNWTLEAHGDTLQELVLLLGSLNYRIYRQTDLVELHDLDEVLREFPNPQTWTINVLASTTDLLPHNAH